MTITIRPRDRGILKIFHSPFLYSMTKIQWSIRIIKRNYDQSWLNHSSFNTENEAFDSIHDFLFDPSEYSSNRNTHIPQYHWNILQNSTRTRWFISIVIWDAGYHFYRTLTIDDLFQLSRTELIIENKIEIEHLWTNVTDKVHKELNQLNTRMSLVVNETCVELKYHLIQTMQVIERSHTTACANNLVHILEISSNLFPNAYGKPEPSHGGTRENERTNLQKVYQWIHKN